ncbi:Alpha/Beta hydrolase protein [Pisolithus marmoratus]|nr:Alpha/Beta hydrolase protein [Pisolithus marmoratus]
MAGLGRGLKARTKNPHIPQGLEEDARLIVETEYGPIRGGRTINGAAIFLEIPYALPPVRFTDSKPLPEDYCPFVKVVSPSHFSAESKIPVIVYVHEGYSAWFYPDENFRFIHYLCNTLHWNSTSFRQRLSVLHLTNHGSTGIFGLKDQWIALCWIRENITALELPTYVVCQALHLDPEASAFSRLYATQFKFRQRLMMGVVRDGSIGIEYRTFRGCLDGEWMTSDPDPMSWQRYGNLARKLREKDDVLPNILRHCPRPVVQKLMPIYRSSLKSASAEEVQRFMGGMLGDGQVYLLVRVFPRDFHQAGFSNLEQVKWNGYIIHATDRRLWALRVSITSFPQREVAITWLDVIDKELNIPEREGKQMRALNQALTLPEDQTIG